MYLPLCNPDMMVTDGSLLKVRRSRIPLYIEKSTLSWFNGLWMAGCGATADMERRGMSFTLEFRSPDGLDSFLGCAHSMVSWPGWPVEVALRFS